MSRPHAYLPGTPPASNRPLGRYLPPLPEGVVSAWLSERLPHHGHQAPQWVLDPFCAAPQAAIEAARMGYRVLVAANNPVARFLLEMAAKPPSKEELQAALAELAATRKGDERLEPHIRNLYLTMCDRCLQDVVADAFLWDRESNKPYARIYTCPACGESGEHPAIAMDISRATQFASSRLHHARALERVAPLDDSDPFAKADRRHAEEALETYLPRALYALFTIINKLEGMVISPGRRDQLSALVLSACDQANSLWQHPSGRARPRQLSIPARFREHNVWLALEEAVEQWANGEPEVALKRWPELPPPEGGISLFEGRLKDLVENLGEIQLGAVIAPLPRPNQAFWTLSALWAGWLWGREAVGAFKSVLRRRRYDWVWHCIALHAAWESLAPLLKPGTPILGLIGEMEPGFLSAALVSAEAAGLELQSLAMRSDAGQAQNIWERPAGEGLRPREASKATPLERIDLVRKAARQYLLQRGEPSSYINLHAAGLVALIEAHSLDRGEMEPGELMSQANASMEGAFSYQGGFLRYGAGEALPKGEKSLEAGRWWLRDASRASSPQSDRVEKELVRLLIERKEWSRLELDRQICAAFPGLFTPGAELVQVCLEAYAQQDPPGSERWSLREQENPAARRADMEEIRQLLIHLGERLSFKPKGEKPLLWVETDGSLGYAFYVIASAVIGELIFTCPYPPERSLVVIPGGRANLVAFKIQHDPRLRQAMESGWRFLKYRQVRWLYETAPSIRDNLDELLRQDAPTYNAPQMRLL